jgi:glycosyltransferase involved in cell wall biosynthesis
MTTLQFPNTCIAVPFLLDGLTVAELYALDHAQRRCFLAPVCLAFSDFDLKRPSIALVHDWLDGPGGGEAVLESLVALFPDAPVFTLVDFLSAEERARFGTAAIRTSPLQRAPFARHWFRYAAALAPRLVEQLDTACYDVILSDSHALAKGVRKRPGQVHICYCHTPARFAWTMASTYSDRAAAGNRIRMALAERAQAKFRAWDLAASRNVDHFVANSRHIADAISRCYGRESTVIYPPVDVNRFQAVGHDARSGDYVTVSRLVAYKRIDVIIDAFRHMAERRLIVVGDGPERARLARNLPPNVTLAGRLDDAETANLLGSARAFVFAANEDFGIAPLEAQAAGTPVIAYAGGGSAETIRGLDSMLPTGVLFDAQTPAAIVAAVARFEAATIGSDACRLNAARFAEARFRAEFAVHFDSLLQEHHGAAARPARG